MTERLWLDEYTERISATDDAGNQWIVTIQWGPPRTAARPWWESVHVGWTETEATP